MEPFDTNIYVTTEVTIDNMHDPEGETRLLASRLTHRHPLDDEHPFEARKYGGGPYGDYWSRDRVSYRVCINDIDVTARPADRFDAAPEPAPSTTPGVSERIPVRNQSCASAQHLNIFNEASGASKTKRVQQQALGPIKHEPRTEYHNEPVRQTGIHFAIPLQSPREQNHRQFQGGALDLAAPHERPRFQSHGQARGAVPQENPYFQSYSQAYGALPFVGFRPYKNPQAYSHGRNLAVTATSPRVQSNGQAHGDGLSTVHTVSLEIPRVMDNNPIDWQRRRSLREISTNVTRKIARPFSREHEAADMTPLPLQHPAVPDIEANLTYEQVTEIDKWSAHAISERQSSPSQDDAVQALTTRELLRLGGSRIDTIEVAKHYSGPPNTPRLRPSDAEPVDEIEGLSLDTDKDLQKFDTPAQAKRKDLIKYLGHARHASIHLVAGNIAYYDTILNRSDYYGIQLVEPRTRNCKKVRIGPELEDPIVKQSTSSDETDNTAVERADDIESLVLPDDDDEICDPNPNLVFDAPSYPPAQSMVLYLHGKGMSVDYMIDMLMQLDEKFLALKEKNKEFAGIRFPDQLDWNDDWVSKAESLCGAKQRHHKWENMVKEAWKDKVHGKAYKLAKKNNQLSKMREFLEGTVENHLFWRLSERERLHPELY